MKTAAHKAFSQTALRNAESTTRRSYRSTSGLEKTVQKLATQKERSANRHIGHDAGGRANDNKEKTQRRTEQPSSDNSHGGEPVTQHASDERTSSVCEHEPRVHRSQGQRIDTSRHQR
jgi:hypothetical protein